MNLKHISKIEDLNRIAVAPYNFVELPAKVVEAEQPLPSGNRYHPHEKVELPRHTGRIECTLTTKSKLYTRCGWSPEDFAKYGDTSFKDLPDELQQKRANFFINPATQQPIIPGSSIRGMLRTLVEIVSFSKIERVSDNQRLFFRAVTSNPKKESWGEEYKQYVSPKKVEAGYLKKDNQGWYIQPAKIIEKATFAWVRQADISLPGFINFDDDGYEPQYINVSYQNVAVDQTDRAKRLFAHNVELPDTHLKKGVFVTSGNMKQKEDDNSLRCNHCIVFPENEEVDPLPIDNIAIEHYRNALTDFQKKLPFDKDWGVLEKGRPVFYYHDGKSETVGFFGQSPNFRIPYSPEGNGHATTVADFIPPNLKKIVLIDLADAIFGWVKQDSENEKLPKDKKQRSGRVFITDAILEKSQIEKVKQSQQRQAQEILLSSPKLTTFQHYLVQPDADKSNLKHYASKPPTETEAGETVIRGHKLYWHKPCKIEVPKNSDTQTSLIKPIDSELQFTFDIYFENLSKVELGTFLWVLSLSSEKSQTLGTCKSDEKYCFSLGMGKPLGMGAVKIDYNLHLSKRNERYSRLFNDAQWKTGEEDQSQTAKEEEESVKTFEEYVLDRICCQDYPINKSREQLQHLKELPRIEMLLAMLQCNKIPDVDKTRYMRIEPKPSEYAERRVLPTPLDIRGIPDNRRFPDINH
ncbi:TIGR03986 family type III CRISPR-associated RAMP protein [Allocoleopsis franciscana]|uniref:CRISPR-associated protein n=1 Tax=Allocoleopsis franciscana PCC 7113 TaxID=1173027 RepID=K9WF42_9CYAN|nr:TIGR03986 family CRISPR-associated RAMP protein [Allocoleopsis franciscana]AFZ18421.1 CRISPR-associated protein [Allocoleopsis franciscana PCC 7113]